MLKLENISVVFQETQALNGITAQLEPGDFVVIIGPNGAGKSTLLQTIVGSFIPTQGSLWLDNNNITYESALKRASLIGRVHQNPLQGTISDMTVEENLALACYKGKKARFHNAFKKWQKVLDNVQISFDNTLLSKPMGKLSGGQRQLIAFVMATIYPCKILLLDEPTAALDPKSTQEMLKNIEIFAKSHQTVTFLITHDLDIALERGNKLWIMKEGKLIKEFTQKEKILLKEADLKQLLYNPLIL